MWRLLWARIGPSLACSVLFILVFVGQVIRSAIEQRALDDLRARESAWVRSVIGPDVDVASLLKILTTERLVILMYMYVFNSFTKK